MKSQLLQNIKSTQNLYEQFTMILISRTYLCNLGNIYSSFTARCADRSIISLCVIARNLGRNGTWSNVR